MDKIIPKWTGSEITESLVRKQILARFGQDQAEKYNPKENCFTLKQWNNVGFRVRKGEKALQSYVVVEKKDKQGQVLESYPKRINLFYICQVDRVGLTD